MLIHLAMADYSNEYGRFYVSQKALAERAKCSVEYVRKSVNKMVEDGFLVIEYKGERLGKSTEYRLRKPEPLPNTVGQSEEALPNSDGGTNQALPNFARGQSSYIANSQSILTTNVVNIENFQFSESDGEEFVDMSWPVWEDAAKPQPKKRSMTWQDEDEAGAVGKLPQDKREMRQAKYGIKPEQVKDGRQTRPEDEWTTGDLVAEFYALTASQAPGIPSQVNAKQLSTWINRQVGQGVPRKAVLKAIRRFFNDPRNIREAGVGKPLYRRFMAFFPTVVGAVVKEKAEIDELTLDMASRSQDKFLRELGEE
jgi:hypothetical protein